MAETKTLFRFNHTLPEKSIANYSASDNSGDELNDHKRYCSRLCCFSCRVSSGASICIGLVLFLLGIWAVVRTPYQFLLNERLKMVPGQPLFEWWKVPPDVVVVHIYVFNVTNGDEFVSGKAEKLHMDEIGPFVFREKLEHTNVRFHENNTMSYVATRTANYAPDMNTLDLDATIVVPNLAVLGAASYLHDAPFFKKVGFNMVVRSLRSSALSTTSIRNYFWNMTDPLLTVGRTLMPDFVPYENIGTLPIIYSDLSDDVSVFIGVNNDRKFFTMDRFRGNRRLGLWPREQCDSVENATEGVSYHLGVRREDKLRSFRKSLCRAVPLYFAQDERRFGMDAMRFEIRETVFHRVGNGTSQEDCFTLEGSAPLASGLHDMSPCYYGIPIVASLPHFYGAGEQLRNNVDGMRPEKAKHGSYVVLEPTTGTPMEGRGRVQANILVRRSGVHLADRFAGLTIPMFWLDYEYDGLPWYLSSIVIFCVVILPVLQTIVTVCMIGFGLYQTWRGTRSLLQHQRPRSLSPVLLKGKERFCPNVRPRQVL